MTQETLQLSQIKLKRKEIIPNSLETSQMHDVNQIVDQSLEVELKINDQNKVQGEKTQSADSTKAPNEVELELKKNQEDEKSFAFSNPTVDWD